MSKYLNNLLINNIRKMDIQDTIKQEGESKNIPEKNKIPRPKKHKKKPHHPRKQGENTQITSILGKDSVHAMKDPKKINKVKKESKPVEVIDKDRFNSLKAVFEKREDKSNTAYNKPSRLNVEKLSTFTNKENIKTNDNSQYKPTQLQGLSDGIKKRMENLFSSNINTSKPIGYVDPVLENIKVRGSLDKFEYDEDSQDEEFDDDVVFSENSSFGTEDDDNTNEIENEENDLILEEDDIRHYKILDRKENENTYDKHNEENVKEENAVVNKVPLLGIDENLPIFEKNPNLNTKENDYKASEDSDELNL